MISFKFSKSQNVKRLKDSTLRDESTKEVDEETDFVTAVEGKVIQGLKKPKVKEELVIPLIKKNEWKSAKTLEDQAVRELLEEAEDKGSETGDAVDDIPLLMQNKVPDGYEMEENMDVSLRPSESTLEDYEKIPIEQFGMAMLRGMGWSSDTGIGLRNKKHVEMIEPQLRPKGLGLGASVMNHNKPAQTSGKQNDKEELVFKIGAPVLINKGSNKNAFGKIESFDEDNNRVLIKLSIARTIVAVSKFYVTLVTESEYKTKAKVLNNEKYDRLKKEADEREAKLREEAKFKSSSSLDSSSSSRHRSKHKDRKSDRRYKERSPSPEYHRSRAKDRSKRESKKYYDKKYKT